MAEIILNLIGLDDLADYGEFIFEHSVESPAITIAQQNQSQQIYSPRFMI